MAIGTGSVWDTTPSSLSVAYVHQTYLFLLVCLFEYYLIFSHDRFSFFCLLKMLFWQLEFTTVHFYLLAFRDLKFSLQFHLKDIIIKLKLCFYTWFKIKCIPQKTMKGVFMTNWQSQNYTSYEKSSLFFKKHLFTWYSTQASFQAIIQGNLV